MKREVIINYRRRRIWHRALSILVCITVLATTYALILPAITLESSSDEAVLAELYSNSKVLSCPLTVHRHTEECYNEAGELVCGYADFVVHTHSKSCYAADGSLVCTLPQIEAHTHDINCMSAESLEAKTPTDAESEEKTAEYICGKDEIILHTHGDECYDENGNLICGMLEIKEHIHTASCFKMAKVDISSSYNGVEIGIHAKENSFPVVDVPLTVTAGEPSQADLDAVEAELGGRYIYTAVDIKVMSGDEQVQPTEKVEVSFKNLGSVDADSAFVWHVEADGSLKKLDVSRNDDGTLTVNAEHFSTFAIGSPIMAAPMRNLFANPPMRGDVVYSERLNDRSNDIGVFSEGYEDSPYTYEKTYNASANLWIPDIHNRDGGTVYIARGALTGDNIKVWQAEQFWDGKAPFRITSAEGANGTVDFQAVNDFMLEDGSAPNAPIKYDNVTLEYCKVNAISTVQNLYGRGNKFVIGENVTTEAGKTWKLYGGTEHNRDLIHIGRPDIITNVVVASGEWGYVFGGGEGATGRGTQATVRGDANVDYLYGGGERKGSVGINHEPGTGEGINVYVEGGTVNHLYGGSEINGRDLLAIDGYALTINEDINIDVTDGHVGKLVAGDNTTNTSIMDHSVLMDSPINGNAIVNISSPNSVDAVLGDTNRNAPTNTADPRQVKGYTLLNVTASNAFTYFDNFDVVNIAGENVVVTSQEKPGVSFTDANPTYWKASSAYSDGYIGQIRVAEGAKLILDKGAVINAPYTYLGNTNYIEPDKQIKASVNHDPFYLSHSWVGETSEDRRTLSTVSINGQGAGITAASATEFADGTDVCGLRIHGNVQGELGTFKSENQSYNTDVPGYSTLEVAGTPIYSTGENYYYYIVADSSANGGKAFDGPEDADYIVCYRNLEGGKIGWYLRERPEVSVNNVLVRTGDAENGKVVISVNTKSFGYEWGDDNTSNRIDLSFDKTTGTSSESLTNTTDTVSIDDIAGIESDTSGRFVNAVFDESSGVKQLKSFDCVIDDSNPIDPSYYDAAVRYHVTSNTRAAYDDVRTANTADGVRCVYDFAGNDRLHNNDGYMDSVMNTSPYSTIPAGADKALLRVYLPDGVTGDLSINEDDGTFAFTDEGPDDAQLDAADDVVNNYSTAPDDYAESNYAVKIGGDDLLDGVSKELTDPVTKYECEVSSYKNITISDITENNEDGLKLNLALSNLKKDGDDVGSGSPAAVNNGELQIRAVPTKNSLVITKQVENETTDKAFPFTVKFTDDEGNDVIPIPASISGTADDIDIGADGTVSFTLKDGDSIRIADIPSGSHFDLSETEHVGFSVVIKENDTPVASDDSLENSTLDRNRTLVVVNSGGYTLPATGRTINYKYLIFGAILILIPVAIGYLLWRRARRLAFAA